MNARNYRAQNLSAVFLLSMVSLASHPAVAESWSGWRGPLRTGKVQQTLPTSVDGSSVRWEKALGPSYSGPIVQNGLVFTTETIDKKFERVTAYNLIDGKLAWETQWEGSLAVPFFAAANGDWIRSTPAVTDGHLIVFGIRDMIVDLDPATGKENWRIDLPTKLGTPIEAFGAVCSPLIDGEFVYLQTGGGLVKIALKDGEVIWRVLDSDEGMSGGAFSSPIIATIAQTRQLIVQTRLELCGVDLADGKVLWKQPIEAFRGMNILTPTVIGDSIFTAAHSGSSEMFDVSKNADQWTIERRWQQKGQGYMSSPIVIDNHIYLHQKSERMVCLKADDGSLAWTSPPLGKYASMIHDGKNIAALSADGNLRIIAADPTEFRVILESQVAENSWAHLAMDDGCWIIRDLSALKIINW
jgi:outer membrane protein assembly factor BamB